MSPVWRALAARMLRATASMRALWLARIIHREAVHRARVLALRSLAGIRGAPHLALVGAGRAAHCTRIPGRSPMRALLAAARGSLNDRAPGSTPAASNTIRTERQRSRYTRARGAPTRAPAACDKAADASRRYAASSPQQRASARRPETADRESPARRPDAPCAHSRNASARERRGLAAIDRFFTAQTGTSSCGIAFNTSASDSSIESMRRRRTSCDPSLAGLLYRRSVSMCRCSACSASSARRRLSALRSRAATLLASQLLRLVARKISISLRASARFCARIATASSRARHRPSLQT